MRPADEVMTAAVRDALVDESKQDANLSTLSVPGVITIGDIAKVYDVPGYLTNPEGP
jgi:hypothetical protein